MMKKLFLSVLMLLASLSTFAQHNIGATTIKPYLGLSYASMFNGDLDFRRSLMVGVDIEKRLARWFSVSGGLAYAPMGGKYQNGNGDDFIWKHDYITFPLTANFYPVMGLAFKTGLQPGVSIRNRQKSLDNKTILDRDMEGNLNSFDLAVPVALSYELFNVVLEVRWNIGLTSVGKSDPWNDNVNLHNSHIGGANFAYLFTLGYQFDL